ncbi:hypothetical protein [Bacillus paramycoides]|uniref:Uncharacterized protein n=1 Tax=Bacillus paramycoides TaxID=2026194 RepID=A0ABU6N2D9_9BACI|nr:hypothetical protein [Bacillus paramycoides]
MKKIFLVLVALLTCILIFNVYVSEDDTTKSAEDLRVERIAKVLENAWDKYDLSSFQMDGTDSIIWIVTEKNENQKELLAYLEKNIRKSDLKHYEIKISEEK